MKVVVLGLAVVLAGNAQGAADVAVPLRPSGKWSIRYETSMCGLTRVFGVAPRGPVAFDLQPTTLGDAVKVLVVVPKGFPIKSQNRPARLTLLPSKTAIGIRYERHGKTSEGGYGVFLTIARDDVPALMKAPGISIESSAFTVSIAPTAGEKALTELTTCETGLATEWGVDPAIAAAVATPARSVSNVASWIDADDYPASARDRGSLGSSLVLWQIGTDGKVHECRAVRSAGDPDLDAAACRAITKRGRYSPALDKNGHAVASWFAYTVGWAAPADYKRVQLR